MANSFDNFKLFKIVWFNGCNAQVVWYNSFKSYETTNQNKWEYYDYINRHSKKKNTHN